MQAHSFKLIDESALKILQEVNEMFVTWTQEKGPVTGWQKTIIEELQEGECEGKYPEVAESWEVHARMEKVLMKDLESLSSSYLPANDDKKRGVFRHAFKLTLTLQAGISAIEACIFTFEQGI